MSYVYYLDYFLDSLTCYDVFIYIIRIHTCFNFKHHDTFLIAF